MPKNDDDIAAAILTAGAVVLGAGIGMAIWEDYSRRQAFKNELRAALLQAGYELTDATLGKLPSNEIAWNLTVSTPRRGLQSLKARFAAGTDAYAASTREAVAHRAIAWLRLQAA